MIKYILIFTLCSTFALSDTEKIKTLQAQFQRDVIELHIFQKRFGTYLNESCNEELQCFRKTIKKLKSWQSVQTDKKLQYYFNKKKKKLKFDSNYWNDMVSKLHSKKIAFEKSEFISVIDLDKQLFVVVLWDNTSQQFHFIGQDLISSGNIQREKEVQLGEDHYLKTPAGVFISKQGWRSDGKKSKDNVSLGYGKKDRFVFYFGRQESIRYNTFDKNKQKIYDPNKWNLITDHLEFAVHAHSSSRSLGIPNSHGCIRMTDELNRFLDNNFILHKNALNDNEWSHRYSKKPNDPQNYNFAGEYLIIFDTIAKNEQL